MVIPNKLQDRVLKELHDGHMGVIKMKALARSYVWWPNINVQLVELAKACSGCQQNQNMPTKAPSVGVGHYTMAKSRHRLCRPISELHVFSGFRCAQQVEVEVLPDLFPRFGIPEQIVSDNGNQFVSEEFQAFVKSKGIHHITSAPYHPATNGLAERKVQTFKQALSSMHQSSRPVNEKVAKLLIPYGNTPHSTWARNCQNELLEVRTSNQ